MTKAKPQTSTKSPDGSGLNPKHSLSGAEAPPSGRGQVPLTRASFASGRSLDKLGMTGAVLGYLLKTTAVIRRLADPPAGEDAPIRGTLLTLRA